MSSDEAVGPTRRRMRRLAMLAVLAVALRAWRNHMLAVNERALHHSGDHAGPK